MGNILISIKILVLEKTYIVAYIYHTTTVYRHWWNQMIYLATRQNYLGQRKTYLKSMHST